MSTDAVAGAAETSEEYFVRTAQEFANGCKRCRRALAASLRRDSGYRPIAAARESRRMQKAANGYADLAWFNLYCYSECCSSGNFAAMDDAALGSAEAVAGDLGDRLGFDVDSIIAMVNTIVEAIKDCRE